MGMGGDVFVCHIFLLHKGVTLYNPQITQITQKKKFITIGRKKRIRRKKAQKTQGKKLFTTETRRTRSLWFVFKTTNLH